MYSHCLNRLCACAVLTRVEDPSRGFGGRAKPPQLLQILSVGSDLLFWKLNSSLMDPHLDLRNYGTGKWRFNVLTTF